MDVLAARLERSLVASDLRLSGAALYRKVTAALEGSGYVLCDGAFLRVPQDPSTVAINLDQLHDFGGETYLLFQKGTGVRALHFPLTGLQGATYGPWRCRGNRLVATFHDTQGNWSIEAVALLEKRRGEWRLRSFRETEAESAGISFVGSGLDRLKISTRSYRFKVFSQPHAGPLLTVDTVWEVGDSSISVSAPRFRRTPLYDLDRFVDAVHQGDQRTMRRLCTPHLLRRAIRLAQGKVNGATCPDSIEEDKGRLFGLLAVDRLEPTTYFEMVPWRGGWRIGHLRTIR